MQFMTYEGVCRKGEKNRKRDFTNEIVKVRQGFVFDPSNVNTTATAKAWAGTDEVDVRPSCDRTYRIVGQTNRSESHAQVWYVADIADGTMVDLREDEFHYLFFNGLIEKNGTILVPCRFAKNGSQYRLLPQGNPDYVNAANADVLETKPSDSVGISIRDIEPNITYKDEKGGLYIVKRLGIDSIWEDKITVQVHRILVYSGFSRGKPVREAIDTGREYNRPNGTVFSPPMASFFPSRLVSATRKNGLLVSDIPFPELDSNFVALIKAAPRWEAKQNLNMNILEAS